MNVVFRTDASVQIGIGHVMRCLTLADALKGCGAICRFICREHPGNLSDLIRQRGFEVHGLPNEVENVESAEWGKSLSSYAAWLGTDWATDAEQTRSVLSAARIDWLIVDNYALDFRWERRLRPICGRLMVIDDLANRVHHCDLLLDQNLGREVRDYANLVPDTCTVLVGTNYALISPEFAALREYSLNRRVKPQLKNLLVTMGGVDQPNATGQVLKALMNCPLPVDCHITVVMGQHAPWLEDVKIAAAQLPWLTEVLVNTRDMAQLMADSDLAIGAAGSTSWERCCLGLPTLMVVLAENQRAAALHLADAQAVITVELGTALEKVLCKQIEAFIGDKKLLTNMMQQASSIVDGRGCKRVRAEFFGGTECNGNEA